MSAFNDKKGRPLGEGILCPAGSIQDKELSGNLRRYKARVAGSYRALLPEEMESELSAGKFWFSPKVDGELWFLVLGAGPPWLASPQGKVISGNIPLLEEASAAKAEGPTTVAGELFAAVKSGRPRVGDLKSALGGEKEAEVQRLEYAAFDLVEGGSESTDIPPDDYGERLGVLQNLFGEGKRLKTIKTHELNKPNEITSLYEELVTGGKAEGLVARSEQGIVYKLKPSITLDMVILGYTERTGDSSQVRSLLLGLMREDGQCQIISGCGSLGTDENRKTLMEKLKPECVDADFHFASGSGEVYRFVKPECVVEIKVTDIQSENSGRFHRKYGYEVYGKEMDPCCTNAICEPLHPVMTRFRDDKSVNESDVRFSQLNEVTHIAETDKQPGPSELPKSSLVERKVWTKVNKGQTAVQKLMIWKTNKEKLDSNFSAFVVHWTDYSQSRKDPLKREVRLAPDEKIALEIGLEMEEVKIKKGWEEYKH